MQPTEQQQAMQALDAGIAAAYSDDPQAAQAKAREAADVKAWFERIDRARRFDEEARRQYARDRRYARGDSGFDVDVNLIGTFIDIMTAFLYAQDPDVDVLPAPSAEPPSLEALREAAKASAAQDPQLAAAGQAAAAMAAMAGQDPQAAAQAAMRAQADALAQDKFEALRDRYEQRQRDNKAFAETLEIVIARLWQDARLKRQAKRWVRSVLTIGIGWIKASWQTRTARDPITSKQIADLQDNIQRATAMRMELEDEAACADCDARIAEYQRVLASLETQVERVIARGYVIDLVQAEDVQVAPGVLLSEYLDAPWISHRMFMRLDDAQAQFQLPPERLKKAARYYQRKPVIHQDETPFVLEDVSPDDADGYTTAAPKGATQPTMDTGEEFVRVEEIWDRESNAVLTGIEGLECWAKPAWAPKPTTRFYPFVQLATGEVDGQRHPQSLVQRSRKLADEYNRVRTAFADHRKRTKPKTVFNAGMVPPEEAKKTEQGVTQEMIGITPTQPNADIGALFKTLTYAQLDPMLYETQSIVSELERIWGVQEALQGAIQTAKTATEAQIQQTGFHARTGSMRDTLEDALSELAQYTAEVALTNMSAQDAQQIAGPDAFWPEGMTAEDLPQLVSVTIRAGSSGKPNTAAERQAWSTLLPLLQNGIVQIGQMRGATPEEISDRLEALLRETFARTGDHADPDRFIPRGSGQMPQPPMLPGATPPPPGMPMPPTPTGAPPPQAPAALTAAA